MDSVFAAVIVEAAHEGPRHRRRAITLTHEDIEDLHDETFEAYLALAVRRVRNAEDLYGWGRIRRDACLGLEEAIAAGRRTEAIFYLCALHYVNDLITAHENEIAAAAEMAKSPEQVYESWW